MPPRFSDSNLGKILTKPSGSIASLSPIIGFQGYHHLMSKVFFCQVQVSLSWYSSCFYHVLSAVGVEFMHPVEAYYCALCNQFMGDAASAEHHLKTELHDKGYQVGDRYFQVGGARHQVGGTRYQVSDRYFQVGGTRHRVGGTRHQVSDRYFR